MTEQGETLSERELEILRCLASGASNKEIADDLSISPYTVKTHLRNIYGKLGVSTRTEATTVALQQGYLTLDNSTLTVSESPNLQSPISNLQEEGIRGLEIRDLETELATDAAALRKRPQRWRTAAFVLLLLVVVVAAGALVLQLQGGGLAGFGATPTAAPFVEEAIGETRWLASRPLPTPRSSRATAAIGLDIYQIGGETAEGVTSDVQVFNTAERTWRTAAAKPTAVADATATVLFGEIYVPGGRLENGEPTAVVEAYSPSQNAWRPVTPLPQPVAGGLALSDGSFLYLIGGWNGSAYLDTVYVYDPGADSWRPLATLPETLAFAAGDVLTGELYVVGGRSDKGESDHCYVYNPPTRAWGDCPPLLLPRAGAGATVLLNKLYVVGGQPGDAAELRAGQLYGEVYDPNTGTWQVLNLPFSGEEEWWQPGVVHVETRIYAQGGRQGETLLDANLVYAPFVYQTFIPAASSEE